MVVEEHNEVLPVCEHVRKHDRLCARAEMFARCAAPLVSFNRAAQNACVAFASFDPILPFLHKSFFIN